MVGNKHTDLRANRKRISFRSGCTAKIVPAAVVKVIRIRLIRIGPNCGAHKNCPLGKLCWSWKSQSNTDAEEETRFFHAFNFGNALITNFIYRRDTWSDENRNIAFGSSLFLVLLCQCFIVRALVSSKRKRVPKIYFRTDELPKYAIFGWTRVLSNLSLDPPLTSQMPLKIVPEARLT